MNDFLYLIPIALCLGAAALAAFMWSLRAGQYDDLEGAAVRVLSDHERLPLPDEPARHFRVPPTS